MEYVEGSYQPDGAGFAVPDAPHMEIMFDALNDEANVLDVTGTESLSLTQAQHYAYGVLMASGTISGHQVAGNEGIFSSIGNGFKAVYDYIVKTFKSIWDFFFGRDSAKDAETAKDAIDENTAELQAAANGSQSEADADKTLNAMATAAGGEGGDKALAEDIAKAKKGSLAEKKAAIKKALKEMPKLNKKAMSALEKTVQQAVQAKAAFMKILSEDGSKKEKEAAAHLAGNHDVTDNTIDMASEVTKFATRDAQFVGKLKNALKITDVNAAIQFNKDCAANISSLKAFSDVFKNKKTAIEKLLSQAEAKMKKAKDAKDKASLQKDIAALRQIVGIGVRTAKLIEANYTRVTAASEAINNVFGIKEAA